MRKKQESQNSGCLLPLIVFLLLWFVLDSKDEKYQEKPIKSQETVIYSNTYNPNFNSYTPSNKKNRGKCSITTCCDGTCSKSTGRGTCSHHQGVCN